MSMRVHWSAPILYLLVVGLTALLLDALFPGFSRNIGPVIWLLPIVILPILYLLGIGLKALGEKLMDSIPFYVDFGRAMDMEAWMPIRDEFKEKLGLEMFTEIFCPLCKEHYLDHGRHSIHNLMVKNDPILTQIAHYFPGRYTERKRFICWRCNIKFTVERAAYGDRCWHVFSLRRSWVSFIANNTLSHSMVRKFKSFVKHN